MLFLLSCLAFLCQEMVLANINDLIQNGGEDLEDLLTINGMEMKDGEVFFHGEPVQSVSEVPLSSESVETDESGGPSNDYGLSPPSRYGYRRYNDDILNNVEEVTPIKSIQEVKSIQEIKKMLPVKSIQEIKSIKEIKDKLARNFIRSHGLKNLINDEGGVSDGYYTKNKQPAENEEDLYQLRKQIIKDSKQCQLLKEKVSKSNKKLIS